MSLTVAAADFPRTQATAPASAAAPALSPGLPETAAEAVGAGLLSPREREIFELLSRGLTGERIATDLFLSADTVKTHIRNAMGKLDAATRVHAIAIAIIGGYISCEKPAEEPSCISFDGAGDDA